MIFILVARHRVTQEIAAWTVERENLWEAMRERHKLEPPYREDSPGLHSVLSSVWLSECDIALMEPGTVYSAEIWEDIRRAAERHERQETIEQEMRDDS